MKRVAPRPRKRPENLLKSQDWKARKAAVIALARTPRGADVQRMLGMLSDGHPAVRLAAIAGLGRYPKGPVEEGLAYLMATEHTPPTPDALMSLLWHRRYLPWLRRVLTNQKYSSRGPSLLALTRRVRTVLHIRDEARQRKAKALLAWADAELEALRSALPPGKGDLLKTRPGDRSDPTVNAVLPFLREVRRGGRYWRGADARLRRALLQALRKIPPSKNPVAPLLRRANRAILHWRGSCRTVPLQGLCARLRPPTRAHRKRGIKRPVWSYALRNRAVVKRVESEIKAGLALWDGGKLLTRSRLKPGEPTARAAKYAAARLMFLQADIAFAVQLRLKLPRFPHHNQIAQMKRATKKFSAYLKQRLTAGGELVKQYQAIYKLAPQGRDGDILRMRALQREGWIFDSLAQALEEHAPPRGLSGPSADAYQAQMEKFFHPLVKKAAARYRRVLALADRTGRYPAVVLLCARRLAMIDSQGFSTWRLAATRPGLPQNRIQGPVLDMTALRRVIRQNNLAALRCFIERVLTKHPDLKRTKKQLNATFRVTPDGTVTGLKRLPSKLAHAGLEKCLFQVVRKLRFPVSPGRQVGLTCGTPGSFPQGKPAARRARPPRCDDVDELGALQPGQPLPPNCHRSPRGGYVCYKPRCGGGYGVGRYRSNQARFECRPYDPQQKRAQERMRKMRERMRKMRERSRSRRRPRLSQ